MRKFPPDELKRLTIGIVEKMQLHHYTRDNPIVALPLTLETRHATYAIRYFLDGAMLHDYDMSSYTPPLKVRVTAVTSHGNPAEIWIQLRTSDYVDVKGVTFLAELQNRPKLWLMNIKSIGRRNHASYIPRWAENKDLMEMYYAWKKK